MKKIVMGLNQAIILAYLLLQKNKHFAQKHFVNLKKDRFLKKHIYLNFLEK